MTKNDLDVYLLMIERRTVISKVDAKYHGGSDMSKQLEEMAILAINKYHNESPNQHNH